MTAAEYRFKTVIERIGEPIIIDGVDMTGIAVVLSPGNARQYMIDADIAAISTRPMFTVYVPADQSPATGDAVTWSHGSGQVKRVVDLRIRGVTIGKLVVVA